MNSEQQDSVVLVTSVEPDNNRFGTAFVIYKDKQAIYLLTCAHVVKDVGGAEKLEVSGIRATVIASDVEERLDLAVLRVEGFLNKSPLRLCVSGEKGSSFITAGFQLFAQGFLIRQLEGILGEQVGLESRLSGKRIKAWDLEIDLKKNNNFDLQPGYSGSPVVDQTSKSVLGIVSHRQGEGRGLAISIEALREIWQNMPSELCKIFNSSKQSKREGSMAEGLMTGRRERSQRTYARFQDEWNLRSNNIKRLREQLAIEASMSVKIQLEWEIQNQEAQLEHLEKELGEIEQALQQL